MGSPYYMAPEQWADDEPDSRSDIYSLGVMLYQMLAGDVPFKGSSIPAIMKKHVSDPAPRFIELGVTISPEIEAAVLHTLQKEKEQRTPSVEAFINELREAIYPAALGHSTASGRGSLPVSTLSVHTRPPQSSVYVDNVSVGQSRDDGWLMLEGIQSGNHHLRVSHAGFQDWFGDVVCDGKPARILAELRAKNAAGQQAVRPLGQTTSNSLEETQISNPQLRGTTPERRGVARAAPPAQRAKRRFFSPLVLGLGALVLLAGLGVAGLAGAYFMGLLPKIGPQANRSPNVTPTAAPTASVEPGTPPTATAELAQIPGGSFRMGRNAGKENERPEHEVAVKPFAMDKTEVTNGEYYDFVKATDHKPVPVHWVNGQPIPGQEKMPVRFVNLDDAKAFAAWRSKRDGVTYRLPTEQEWEYAARNGDKAHLYPWGDKFEARCAIIDQSGNDPAPVGSKSCPNTWGVHDLIGNVFEWTESEASLYPGSPGEVRPLSEPHMMARGGSAFQKSSGANAISATFRIAVPASRRSPELGFRLVRP
jgi:formylglycine-generating enzyme required for sulfatase activity